ncbi:hypothetical protein [Terrihalobacillus insolitus]|uniref:hypothetical protein n=1 Tax=Terrihalobacillus insolitus TaxID=2950438 RepID=UPI002341CB35|nr:hypothetical protein [Terrihalobacillus insolitus]MDC3414753.1 hypothetical protein [Terrihalobacillus insolitus]
MKLNMLIGTWIGFTLMFVLVGFFENEFEWRKWFLWILGGTIGHLVMVFLTRMKDKD